MTAQPQSETRTRAEATPAGHARPERARPTLVVFYSAKSGSSRRVDGFLAQVLQRRRNHSTFRLLRVEADSRPDLLQRLRVTDVPTLLVLDGGRIRGRLSNPHGCTEISELLSPWLK